MSRSVQRLVFILAAGVFAVLGLGFGLGQFGFFGVHAGGEEDGAYRQMHVYAEVLKRIQSDYVTEPNIGNVTTGALHGLLESLDADSSYLTAAEYKIYKDRPSTGVAQVGVTVSKRFGYATIVSVAPGSAADKEHLADGDVIESIGDQSTRELSLAVIRLMLEGKPGTSVALSVVRPRKPDPGQSLPHPNHRGYAVSERAAVQQRHHSVSQAGSSHRCARRRNRRQAQVRRQKPQGPSRSARLLRRRPRRGDSVSPNFFVDQGTLATLEGQKFTTQTFAADSSKYITCTPLAILINRGTYGAAELTADAIEGAKRGDVVGERTFGEGSVQKTIELPDGGALMLTVAKFEGPDGKKIQDDAVTPTVQVGQPSDDDFGDGTTQPKEDEPLNKALELLKAKTGKPRGL